VDDGQRLLLEHFDVISNSPSQIYHSALLFSPSSSWLRSSYSTELLQEVRVVKGLPAEWGMCSRTVPLHNCPQAFACWRDIVAVGLKSGDIVTLDGITGSRAATLSGHTGPVGSLAFSSDGTSLVSGGGKVVKLWDVQTGGVIRPFHGHTNWVYSVSISATHTMIASGSEDKTIRLWNIQTGGCCHMIELQNWVACVNFSPKNPQYLISISGGEVQQWNTDGHQINSPHNGSQIAFSSDGTQFASCQGVAINIWNSDTGKIETNFHAPNGSIRHCCFSSDGRLVAVATGNTIYVWDITGPGPCIIETFVGHTSHVTSLAFSSPSSLISSSSDQLIKFWQISAPATGPAATNPKSTPLSPALIKSVTLQATYGIVISSDSDGVVKIWDISTGQCKESFQTPAKNPHQSDARQVESGLIVVWQDGSEINIWDVEKNESLQTITAPGPNTESVRISGDGSKVFCLHWKSIQAWSISTGEVIDEVEVEISGPQRHLTVDGPRVWVCSPLSESQGWDYGIPGSRPLQLPNVPSLYLNDTKLWDISQSRIVDTVTGRVVFQLPVRFIKYVNAQWDGWYLVVLHESREVLILDFNSVLQ